jgi:hypothetical protein
MMTRWQRVFRFWALRFFAELTAVVGFCVMVPGIIAAVLMIDNGISLNSPPVQLVGFAVAIVAVLSGIPLIAFSQLMLCIVAIERNTDDAANYLKKMSEVQHEERKEEGDTVTKQ